MFVIGEPGLYNALYERGITLTDTNPDYVVVGEATSYNYDNICRAVHHVFRGARLIATNPDLTGPTEQGIVPACRALVKPIEMVTGQEAYYIGKPNPLMMRTGLNMLGVHSNEAAIIGDRMDTDMVAGIESGPGYRSGAVRRHFPGGSGPVPLSSPCDPRRRGRNPRLMIPPESLIIF